MADIVVKVHRAWTETFPDPEGTRAHAATRSQLLHDLAETLDLEVKDWGDTDADYPREVVEILVALGSAGVFTAMVDTFRTWVDNRKIKQVEIVRPDGTVVNISRATPAQVAQVAQAFGLAD